MKPFRKEDVLLIHHRVKSILSHPVTKRLGLAMLFIFTILRIRRWGGYEPSALFGLLTGMVSYAAAAYILSTPEERRRRLRSIREGGTLLIREHAGTMIPMIFCLTVTFATFGNLVTPKENVVKEVMSLVKLFGTATLLFYVILNLAVANSVMFTTLIRRTARFAAAYGTALWLIGYIGDSVYQFALANPGDAIAGLITAAIVWMIWQVSSCEGSARPEPIVLSGSRAVCAPMPLLTELDTRYVAAHEAGHVLVVAALGRLPSKVTVVINDRSDDNGVLGFVSGVRNEHRLTEKTFAEWYMLVLLAGKVGESTLGETTLGSSTDHLRWLEIARHYLQNHFRGVFYTDPQNKLEQEQNEAKLEGLQQEHLRTLKLLFDLNTEVFRQLADTLLEKRMLTREDLIPLLARVKFPEGFPLPFGLFVEFSSQ